MRPLSPAMAATFPPPVMEARRWLEGVTFPPDRPLINVSQAAPVAAPPEALRAHMAQLVRDDASTHLYGPVLGLPPLRAELASRMSALYQGDVAPEQIAITAGCNQAFCAAVSTLAAPGDEVILPLPWYFNHKMWLDMTQLRAVPLPTGGDLLPDPDAAAQRITERTRAIVLVSPNNPAGVAYPPALIAAFRDLARSRGLALIVDETYRDFHAADGAPHTLFADPDWDDTLIHLYSFSKAYRLTGHRVGAIAASVPRLSQVEKFLDTVAICPPQIGQHAALWGLRNLADWLAGERAEILQRCATLRAQMDGLQGWRLLGAGAYFAYVEHPHPMASPELAQRLVREAGVLMLPGTMFMPEGDAAGASQMRIAFANADGDGISRLVARLADWRP